jgi:thioredoxin-related protein
MKVISLFAFFFLSVTSLLFGQPTVANYTPGTPSIKWVSLEEGMKLARKKHLNVLVDCYTDWCGWCKKMDNETFVNPGIVDYVNSNFVAVKFDAESKNPVQFNDKTYVNQNQGASRSAHQLAIELLGGSLSYPTYLYLDEKGTTITLTRGYAQAEDLLPLLKYIGSNAYKKMSWKEFNDQK